MVNEIEPHVIPTKGTAFEILMEINELELVKDNVYKNKEGNKFILDKLGFHHTETYRTVDSACLQTKTDNQKRTIRDLETKVNRLTKTIKNLRDEKSNN